MTYTTLVNAADLAKNLDNPDWRIFDCRCSPSDSTVGEKRYREGHIPGARHADLDRVLAAPAGTDTGRHPLPDPDAFSVWLAGQDVGNHTQVIAYDDSGGAFAARLWWMLRWVGHDAVAVLDGGLQAWQTAGGKLDTGRGPPPAPRDFARRPARVAAVYGNEVAAIVNGQRPGHLVDARASERFAGRREPIDAVAGHIPGAVNRPFAANLDASGHFIPVEKLRERFLSVADDPSRIVHYCGSGVTACHNLLAMEHAGLSGSRLYPGSWSEWIRNPRHPVDTS